MDATKFKSVVIDSELHELISHVAEEQDRTISGTLKRLVNRALETESNEVNIDSVLVSGGTPRLKRLLEDLRWYRDNAEAIDGTETGKKFIIDSKEINALKIIIEALADTIE